MDEAPYPPLRDDDSDVEPSLANTEDLQERSLPGVVQVVLPIPAQGLWQLLQLHLSLRMTMPLASRSTSTRSSASCQLVGSGFELDDIYYSTYRKGEINPKKLKLEDQEKFIEGKKTELSQYFSNLVWEFAAQEERVRAEQRGRAIIARWVLT